jgi:peptidoglycan/LPS O-acetylase OafA/YrhL
MQKAGAAGVRHVAELDGVRGLAILLVLITHFGVYGQERVGWFGAAFHRLVDFGWSGVDLFFVLSGFLITGILLESKGSPNYFRSFYMRRVLRILPLYYCAVIAYFLFLLPALRILAPGRATVAGAFRMPAVEQLWYYFHLSNWRIAYSVTYNGVDHFWSLAIEEQFYALWPLVVFLLSRRGLLRACAGVMAVSFALRSLPSVHAAMQQYPHLLYCLTPFRLEPLALGAGLAILISDERFRAHWRQWAGAAAVCGVAGLAIVMAVTRSASFEPIPMAVFGFTGVGLVAAACVCYAAMRSGASDAGSALLRSPFLVELGRLSYGIYVIHRPLSILAPPIQGALMPRIGGVAASLLVTLAGSTASYVLAVGSWRLVEQPFLRLKSRFPYRPAAVLKAAT